MKNRLIRKYTLHDWLSNYVPKSPKMLGCVKGKIMILFKSNATKPVCINNH